MADGNNGKKVLIVDDEENTVRAVSHLLLRLGFDCRGANDGEEALEVFERYQPDLVILDIMMPKLDGYAVLERIRANPGKGSTPVILCSSLNADDKIWNGWSLGASYYITKPFNFDELLTGIKMLLG